MENAHPNIGPESYDGPESKGDDRPAIRFVAGATLDAKDSVGKWSEARIVEVKPDAVLVHYLFWENKWDEWISRDSDRLAPHGTESYIEGGTLKVGHRIDALDINPHTNRWMEAHVISTRVDEATGQHMVEIHYQGWHKKFDEWLPARGNRLAPYGRHTKRHTADYLDIFERPRLERQESGAEYIRRKKLGVRLLGNSGNVKFDHFSRALGDQGLRIVEMEGDGNCLFRSVAHQVYGDQGFHMQVRKYCMDYMVRERAFYEAFIPCDFEQYVAAKRQSGCWGDDPEIKILGEIYQRPAHLYVYDPAAGARRLKVFNEQLGGAPMLLSYYGGGHYDSIVGPRHESNLLRAEVGVVEGRMIEHAALRGNVDDALQQSRQTAEQDQLQAALRASRGDWDLQQALDEDIEAAMIASLGGAAAIGGGAVAAGGVAGAGAGGGAGAGAGGGAGAGAGAGGGAGAGMGGGAGLGGGAGVGGGAAIAGLGGTEADIQAAIARSMAETTEKEMMEQAIKASMQQQPSQAMYGEPSPADIEAKFLEQAKEASLAAAYGGGFGGGGGGSGGFGGGGFGGGAADDDEAMMQAALQESLMHGKDPQR